MTKWHSALLGMVGLVLICAPAMAQGNRTIGGPGGHGNSPYLGQSVGGSGGLTGSSTGTAGGSGFGPTITNPHTGVSTQVGGGGGFGLTGRKK